MLDASLRQVLVGGQVSIDQSTQKVRDCGGVKFRLATTTCFPALSGVHAVQELPMCCVLLYLSSEPYCFCFGCEVFWDSVFTFFMSLATHSLTSMILGPYLHLLFCPRCTVIGEVGLTGEKLPQTLDRLIIKALFMLPSATVHLLSCHIYSTSTVQTSTRIVLVFFLLLYIQYILSLGEECMTKLDLLFEA